MKNRRIKLSRSLEKRYNGSAGSNLFIEIIHETAWPLLKLIIKDLQKDLSDLTKSQGEKK